MTIRARIAPLPLLAPLLLLAPGLLGAAEPASGGEPSNADSPTEEAAQPGAPSTKEEAAEPGAPAAEAAETTLEAAEDASADEAPLDEAPLDETPTPRPSTGLDLVYTGGLRGLGPARSRTELQDRLRPALQAAGVTVDAVEVMHGLLAQGEVELWPVDGRIESVLTYAAAEPTCDEGVVVQTARTPTERFVTAPGSPELPVRDGLVEPRRWQSCEAGGISAVALSPPDGPGAQTLPLAAFDLRTAFRWRAGDHEWLQLARPRREPGRRLGVIRAALDEREGALYVDAGDFVDPGGASGDPTWRARREASFDVLRGLQPAALAVGSAELADGLPALLEAAGELPYVATNWRWTAGEPALPAVLRVQVGGEATLDIAFLGVTDPAASAHAPGLGSAGVELMDPVEAVNAAVDALSRAEAAPDLVVLLAHVPPAAQAELRSRLRGVDLLLGDPTAATFRVDSQRTVLRSIGAAFKAAPITLPMDGIAAAHLTFEADVASVEVRPLEVTAESPSDAALTLAATGFRATKARALDRALIGADEPLQGVTAARWQKLVCEAVLEASGADVAFVGGLPTSLPTPGPLTALQVADRLGSGHVLEVHRADGDRFKRFLYAADGAAPIQCGALTGVVNPKASGRLIDPLRTYRVATTDVTRATTRIGGLLPNASSSLVGHRPQFRPLEDADGPVTLDRAVLRVLSAAAKTPGWMTAWESRSSSDKPPQWVLNVRRVSLRVERFEGPRTDVYTSVPESALNSPSSFTVGGDADLALEASGRHVQADLRFVGAYTNFSVDGLPPQETADAWRVSSSIELPAAALPPGGAFRLLPFAEAGFDSEFTPADDESGGTLPRRADLSVFAGLSVARVAGLRSMRLGPFVNRDMGQLDTKLTEFGGRFVGTTFHSPLPLSALWVTTAWDVQVFAPTAQDDVSDLRLRMWGEVRGSVRLVRSLSLGVYLQGLLVQGRVSATSQPAGTITLGVALDLAAALRLDVRPALFPAPRRHP